MIKVLLAEDHSDLGNLLKQYLEIHRFEVDWVLDGALAWDKLHTHIFDIAILDVMMPGLDGFELAAKMRRSFPELHFLFITARTLKEDVLFGLKLGADDYVTKPFDADELILRIRNILRRRVKGFQPKPEAHCLGVFTFDPENLLLTSPSTERVLTEKEGQLLDFLCIHKEQLIMRKEILQHLWQEADFFTKRSLDVFITQLRKYLAEDISIRIESVRGVGYRFLVG